MFESIQIGSDNFELKSKVTWSDSASNRMEAKLTFKHQPTLLALAKRAGLRQRRGMRGYL